MTLDSFSYTRSWLYPAFLTYFYIMIIINYNHHYTYNIAVDNAGDIDDADDNDDDARHSHDIKDDI